MSTERERLVKILYARSEQRNCPTMEQMADALLAAGVTLPPEPPRLVTEEMLNEASKIRGGSQRYWTIELEGASALVESAIRRAVERKRDGIGRVIVQSYAGGDVWVMATSLLALFGLEAS